MEQDIQSIREIMQPYDCSVEEMLQFGLLEVEHCLNADYSLEPVLLEVVKTPYHIPEG